MIRALLALALLSGCAVIRPAGWRDEEPLPYETRATPGNVLSGQGARWDLTSGELVRFVPERAQVFAGLGLYRADVRFELVTDLETLRCETEPSGPDVPETRFGCWSKDLTFWIAPNAGCAARDLAYLETLQNPLCWEGRGLLDGRALVMHHGSVESLRTPHGELAWRFADSDEVLMVADIRNELRVFTGEPAGELPPELRRKLLLLTIAVQVWENATSAD